MNMIKLDKIRILSGWLFIITIKTINKIINRKGMMNY